MSDAPGPLVDVTAIPEEWPDVRAFADWWCASGWPILPPEGAEVFLSDDATAFCLFRRGRFQVEFYMIHPNPLLQEHEHPGVEVIKMRIDGVYAPAKGAFELPPQWGSMSPILKRGQAHGSGARTFGERLGFPLLAFQHWQDHEPSTVAAAWKGETVGPKQEDLIRRFFPNAWVERGYADITKPADYRQRMTERA